MDIKVRCFIGVYRKLVKITFFLSIHEFSKVRHVIDGKKPVKITVFVY